MARNLIRMGSAAALGVASHVLEPPTVAPLNLGGQTITYSTIAETLALVGGLAIQMAMPFTYPNVVDGMVDGGAALVARRATRYMMTQVKTGAMTYPTMRIPAPSFTRSQVGSVQGMGIPRRTLV